jgi:MarR family transcriptional regulator, temperature-dependent positive regulator of motility
MNAMASHLLHSATQRADDLFAKEVGDANITPRQFVLLAAAAELADPSQTDLVKATGIDRSTLADIVRRLMRKGLLERRRSRADGRAKLVRLSRDGERLLKSIRSKAMRADAALLARLTADQRTALLDALKVVSGEWGVPK